LSIADADKECDMAVVRDLSNSDSVFKSHVEGLREEHEDFMITNMGMAKMSLQSFLPVLERV